MPACSQWQHPPRARAQRTACCHKAKHSQRTAHERAVGGGRAPPAHEVAGRILLAAGRREDVGGAQVDRGGQPRRQLLQRCRHHIRRPLDSECSGVGGCVSKEPRHRLQLRIEAPQVAGPLRRRQAVLAGRAGRHLVPPPGQVFHQRRRGGQAGGAVAAVGGRRGVEQAAAALADKRVGGGDGGQAGEQRGGAGAGADHDLDTEGAERSIQAQRVCRDDALGACELDGW